MANPLGVKANIIGDLMLVNLQNEFRILFIAFLVFGCSDDSNPIVDISESFYIKGQISNYDSKFPFDLKYQKVSVSAINDSTSFRLSESEIDSTGKFFVEITQPAESLFTNHIDMNNLTVFTFTDFTIIDSIVIDNDIEFVSYKLKAESYSTSSEEELLNWMSLDNVNLSIIGEYARMGDYYY